MESEDKLWAIFWVAFAAALLVVVSLLFYDSSILPLRMADRGFCWTSLDRTNDRAVWAYLPCKAAK